MFIYLPNLFQLERKTHLTKLRLPLTPVEGHLNFTSLHKYNYILVIKISLFALIYLKATPSQQTVLFDTKYVLLQMSTSLRSKRFHSKYSPKVGAEAKKNGRGSGKGEEETLDRKPHGSFTPLPLPPSFLFFPNFLDELTWNCFLRRLNGN